MRLDREDKEFESIIKSCQDRLVHILSFLHASLLLYIYIYLYHLFLFCLLPHPIILLYIYFSCFIEFTDIPTFVIKIHLYLFFCSIRDTIVASDKCLVIFIFAPSSQNMNGVTCHGRAVLRPLVFSIGLVLLRDILQHIFMF